MGSKENFTDVVENLLSIGSGYWTRSAVEKALKESQYNAQVAFDRLSNGSEIADGCPSPLRPKNTGDPVMNEIEKIPRAAPLSTPRVRKIVPSQGQCAAAAASRPQCSRTENCNVSKARRLIPRPLGELDALQYLLDQPVILPDHLKNIRENPSYINLKKAFFKDPSKLGIAVAEIYQKDPIFYSILKENVQEIVGCLHEPIIIDSVDNIDDIFSPSNMAVEQTTTASIKKPVSEQQDTASETVFGGSWTREDDKQLEQIIAMGFDSAKSRLAYIECNRNVPKAIEKLCLE
uniref:UBA domain-containing protein n=1 Tax=Romanomermis culicivorax TaxID=13658 RepID=A0A915LA51_ROMCU